MKGRERTRKRQYIDKKIGNAAMAGVFDLRNVFELIDNGFRDGPLGKQKFVGEQHQAVIHVRFYLGDRLNAKGLIQFFKQGL